MREERGQLAGKLVVKEPFTLWGSVGGDVKVAAGGKLYVRGAIYGDLTVEFGGRVHIYGNVLGTVTVKKGAKLIHSGIVGGDLVNTGGRLHIELLSKTQGKVKATAGDTTYEEVERYGAY